MTTQRQPAALPGAEQIAIIASLMAIAALSWLYLIVLSHSMGTMPMDELMNPAMQSARPQWTLIDFALSFMMWWIMMIGMMLPTALPMIMMFARVNRSRREKGVPYVPTGVFAGAYLLAWGGYSLVATIAQWSLESLTLMSPMGSISSGSLAGALFVAAGIYQFTPLKHACLRHCRSPLSFVLNAWRDGTHGALVMGTSHGLYCLGCCWVLMALLFAVGIMNLLWVALIAIFVLAEKLLPASRWTARIAGAVMCAWGLFLIAQSGT